MNGHRTRKVVYTVLALLVAAVASLAAYARRDALLTPFMEVLVEDERPFRADAVVVLLGGQRDDRVRKAYELYLKKFAPVIVFGNGYFRSSHPVYLFSDELLWTSAGGWYRAYLDRRGAKPGSYQVVPLAKAVDTASELSGIRDHARRLRWKRVLLVTSPTHTRRASSIWKRLAPDIESRTVSADDPWMWAWWSCDTCRRQVAYEYGAWTKEFIRRVAGR